MSGINSTATLSVEIKTGPALESLRTLHTAYEKLKTEFSRGSVPLAATNELKAQVASLTAELGSLQAKLAQSEAKMSNHMRIMLNTAKMTGDAQVKAFDDTQKALLRLDENGRKIQLRSAEMTGAAQLLVYKKTLTQRAQMAAAMSAEEIAQRKTSSAALLTQELKDARQLAEMSAAMAAEDAAKRKVADAAYLSETRARYKAHLAEMKAMDARSAAERQMQMDIANRAQARADRIAKNSQLNANYGYGYGGDDLKAARNKLRMAEGVEKMMSAGAGSRDIVGAFGSDAFNSVRAGTASVVALRSEIDRLTASKAKVAPASKSAADHQMHWNKVANEGHAFARGLSGSLGALWMTYGSMAPLLAGAAIAGSFVKAAKAGAEFSYQLKFVQALGGETADTIARVSDEVLALSKNSLYGPVELASGMRILAQAGLDANDALKALPETINLATVGEMTMEQAAVTLTGVMNAFGLSVADMPHIGDVFAKAAALSQTSVQGMTEAMKTASVVGEQYSVSMEDAATALTLLAKVNISGTAAGTSLRNMVKELYAPVPQAASAMRKLGLETKDAAGNLKPFADIIYDLKGKLEDFDKAGQVQILQRLFGERGAKEAVAMLALTRDEWEKMKSSISDSEGFMKGVTDDLNAEMKGVWRQTINTFEAELISAYKQVEPVLLDVVKSLKEALTSDEFVSGLRSMISGVTSVLSLVVEYAPLIVNAAKAWLVYKAAMIGASVWTATAGAVGAFSAAMMGLSGVMGPGMTAMAGAKGILAGLAMTLTKIPSPLTLVAGLLAGGAAAWMAWGESGDAALDRVRKMADKAAESVQGLNDLISDIRFDKVSRDVSTRQILDGYKALNTEVDKYKKSLEEVTGSPVELDEQFKPKGQGPSRFMVEAHAELNELRKVLVQKKSALEEATQLNVDRSVGENGELDLTSHGKQRPFRNVKDILGGGAGGGKGGKLGKDWEFEAEKVAIAAVTALQQKEIALLESRNANKLISEEQYQEDLKAIYERFAPTIEALYEQGTDRLAKISASTKGEERERADSHHKQLLADQSKYQNEAELRLQKALDKELGMKLQAQKKADEAIAKARASSQEATDRLRDTKLKLDMTPESAAAYDAGNKSDALFNDAMADRQATIDFMRNRRGLTEENAELREQIKLLEDLKNAKAGARVEAERTAREESAYSRSFEAGWKRAYRAYTDEAANASMYAAKTFNLGVSSMEQALDEFINTGTVDWQKMSRTIILEMAKMELRWLMSKMMNPEGTGAGPGESFGKAIAGLFSSKEEKKPASAAPLSTSGLQGGIDLAPNFESLRYQLDTASMGLATLNANMNGAQLGVSGLGATASTTGMSVSNMTMSTDTAGVALQNVAGAGDDAATSLGRVATSGGAGAAGGGGGSSGLWGMLAGAVANYFVPGSGALVGGIVNAGVAASNKNYTGAATSLVGAAAGSNFGGSEAAITAGSDTLYGPPKPSANGNTFGEGALHRFKIGGTFGRQGLQAFAKGGAFTNHIVTEPTHFKFANGGEMASGLMGEAGPEAVMPLGRDSRGKLGVHLASAGPAQQSAPPPPPQNNIRIVNAFDTGVVGDYMGSADGEKIIMNAVKRNQNTIKQMSRV